LQTRAADVLFPGAISSFAIPRSLENAQLEDNKFGIPRNGDGPRRGSRIRQPTVCGPKTHLNLHQDAEDADCGRGRHHHRGRGGH
jgi:hypothetical protein